MRNGMAQEFSWARTVPKYERIYAAALSARAGAAPAPRSDLVP
jgi:hypothetical protein